MWYFRELLHLIIQDSSQTNYWSWSQMCLCANRESKIAFIVYMKKCALCIWGVNSSKVGIVGREIQCSWCPRFLVPARINFYYHTHIYPLSCNQIGIKCKVLSHFSMQLYAFQDRWVIYGFKFWFFLIFILVVFWEQNIFLGEKSASKGGGILVFQRKKYVFNTWHVIGIWVSFFSPPSHLSIFIDTGSVSERQYKPQEMAMG